MYESCILWFIIQAIYVICMQSNISNFFLFFFLDPPVIREAPQNMSVKAGGIAAFRCIATGDPTPHITWRKNGNKIPSMQSSSRYVCLKSSKLPHRFEIE